MTMYTELLAASLCDQANGVEITQLLVEAMTCRRQLEATIGERLRVEAAESLAINIAYDLALLKLCSALQISCDPRRFSQMLVERRRLEDALAQQGIDIAQRGEVP